MLAVGVAVHTTTLMERLLLKVKAVLEVAVQAVEKILLVELSTLFQFRALPIQAVVAVVL
jgi:hypothetical protein